jgi:hypothetical protein
VESVRLEDGEIVVRGHGVTERFGSAEEACSAIRASWFTSLVRRTLLGLA